jgi:hypothetical protein
VRRETVCKLQKSLKRILCEPVKRGGEARLPLVRNVYRNVRETEAA